MNVLSRDSCAPLLFSTRSVPAPFLRPTSHPSPLHIPANFPWVSVIPLRPKNVRQKSRMRPLAADPPVCCGASITAAGELPLTSDFAWLTGATVARSPAKRLYACGSKQPLVRHGRTPPTGERAGVGVRGEWRWGSRRIGCHTSPLRRRCGWAHNAHLRPRSAVEVWDPVFLPPDPSGSHRRHPVSRRTIRPDPARR